MFVLLLIRDTFKATRRVMETAYLYNMKASYMKNTQLRCWGPLSCFTHKHVDPSLICNTHFGVVVCFVLFLKPSVITRRLGRQTGKFKAS